MALHCARSYGESIQAKELADASSTSFAVENEGSIVGLVQVDRRWHGGGLASVLMKEALAEAMRGNARRVWLGVWERNPRAIAVYRQHGFVESGEHVFVVGTDPQRDVIMSRQLESELS